MELIWSIDAIDDKTIFWRLTGNDEITVEGHMLPIPISYSVYGKILDATDFTIEYVKSILNEAVEQLENGVAEQLEQQKQKNQRLNQINDK